MLQPYPHGGRSRGSRQEVTSGWMPRLLPCTLEETWRPVRHLRLAPELMRRLRTGCLGEELYAETYTILALRHWPRRVAAATVNAWWPALAPLPRLLHSPRRVKDNQGMSWEQFAAQYRADLEALPLSIQNTYLLLLARLLQRHPTVTLLSLEPSRGLPEAEVHAQRRIFWQWLVE
jgi:uncharacterized protein YeaO (DUF488 family)